MKIIARVICVPLLLLTAVLCTAGTVRQMFPLEKGNYWVYKGTVKWANGQKVESKPLTWKMTVHDVRESARGKVAIVTGFPGDVAWYEQGMTPKYSVLVEDDKRVYLNTYQDEHQAVMAANYVQAGAKEKVSFPDCIMEFPLTKGKEYKADPEDGRYAWSVDSVDKVRMKVKGCKSGKPVTKYGLSYRTGADDTEMEFVPGLGITRYVYEHHGTVASEDLRLIECGLKKK